MSIAIIIPDRDNSGLKARLQTLLPVGTLVETYPEIADPEAVEMAIVWKHPHGCLRQFPNLKLIQSYGAGVEHLLRDQTLPSGIPIARIVDTNLTKGMERYVAMAVLAIHKRLDFYLQKQQEKIWQTPEPVELQVRIGILGLGELGAACAVYLAGMGFEVAGYSHSKKELPGISCRCSEEMTVEDFAASVNVLVCLLPLTPQTEGILRYDLFRRMPRGSYLINAARGGHLVDHDLLRAMEEGIIAGAFLDVFHQEPLPPEHPFWTRNNIFITPHSASVTNPDGAAALTAENYRRMKNGLPLLHLVKKEKGY
jgi:glyoxylate/hydroxypyruvate reductase A